MAQVPYKAAPSVEPLAEPPISARQTIDAGPEKFGAHIARGLQQLGAGLEKAGDIWSEIQIDSAANNALKEGDDEFNAYRKLQGQDAIDQEQAARQRINDVLDQRRNQLMSPWQRQQFDNKVKQYQYRYWNGGIANHADEQRKVFTTKTNEDTEQQGYNHIAQNYNSDEEYYVGLQRALEAATKQLQFTGQFGNADARAQAIQVVTAKALSTRAEAMYAHNAPGGYEFVKAHEKEMGLYAAPLLDKFRARAETVDAENTADVTKQIYSTNDPTSQRSILYANKQRLTAKAFDDIDRSIPGYVPPEGTAAPPAAAGGNVVPIRPPPTPGSERQPGESAVDYGKRVTQETTPAAKPTPAVDMTPKPGESRVEYEARLPKNELGQIGGPGAQIHFSLAEVLTRGTQVATAKGRGEILDEVINQYAPGTTIYAPGKEPWTVPPAGTTFEIEGIKHTVPGAPAAAPTQPAAPAAATQPAATGMPAQGPPAQARFYDPNTGKYFDENKQEIPRSAIPKTGAEAPDAVQPKQEKKSSAEEPAQNFAAAKVEAPEGQKAINANFTPVTKEQIEAARKNVFPEAQAKQASANAGAGEMRAVTDQTQRVRNVEGFGDQLTGSIVVNGHTYNFINGGGGRGSIPFGTYNVSNFRTAAERRAQGLHNLGDTFDLSDVKDPLAGGAARQELRIHTAMGGGTAGCIGILGGQSKFYQFAADVRKAGITKLTLGPLNPNENVAAAPTAAPAAAGPANYAAATIQIEKGPKTGSYEGLGQFSKEEQKKYGITDPNDRAQVTQALNKEAAEFKPTLTRVLGRDPQPADYYLAHQQGIGGAVAHLTNPNQPAWENMRNTAEGQKQGDAWAKRAIWGNMTKEMKARFPEGVESVTSADFIKLWAQRFDEATTQTAQAQ